MLAKIVLLLGTVSALCSLSVAISSALLAVQQSGYYKNNEILNGKQQELPLRGDMQKHTENWQLQIQKLQNQQQVEEEEQQRLQQPHIFDPFDFNNLRQLEEKQKQQQIGMQHRYFNNENELEQQEEEREEEERDRQQRNQHQNEHRYQQRQHQPERQALHPRLYKDNENGNKNENNNNEGNEYKSSYSYYLFGNNKSKNNYNKGSNRNDNNDDDVVDYSNGNPNNGDWIVHTLAVPPSTHQDASNDFRLQLSDRNEPVSRKNKNNNNNENKNGSPSITYNINTLDDDHRTSRISTSNTHNSATPRDATTNNNNKIINNNNNKRENNGPNSSNGVGNGAASDTINGHTIKIRDSQSYDHHYSEDDFVDPDIKDYYTADEELNMELPYGIQNVRKRTVRQNTGLEYRSMSTTYQSLCPTKRITIPLETVGYEYRPNHYIEVTCAHNYSPTQSYNHNKNKICSEVGFSCIQLNRTIHLIRRNKAATANCWESEIRIVPSGCECMWPQHSHGDIITYHDTQKRFNPAANVKATADYTPGEGYQQLPRQIELVSIDGTQREQNNDGIGYETYFLN